MWWFNNAKLLVALLFALALAGWYFLTPAEGSDCKECGKQPTHPPTSKGNTHDKLYSRTKYGGVILETGTKSQAQEAVPNRTSVNYKDGEPTVPMTTPNEPSGASAGIKAAGSKGKKLKSVKI